MEVVVEVVFSVNETLREPEREDTGNHSVNSTAYIPVITSPGVFHLSYNYRTMFTRLKIITNSSLSIFHG